MSQDLCRCGSISLLTYLLVILFGIASWVDINGLWVELPILVQNLPEGWDLPSFMVVIIQIANIAPLVYTLASALWPHQKLEVPVIYVIISVGAVSCLLLAFLWNKTSEVAGRQHSTALFGLQFFLALVDCTSSVAFLPFMSRFKPQYMAAYFIGEGFSGLVPSLVALGQGAGSMHCVKVLQNGSANTFDTTVFGNSSTMLPTNQSLVTSSPDLYMTFPKYREPRFSVQIFFFLLMALMLCSMLAFTLLNYWSYCSRDLAHKDDEGHSMSSDPDTPEVIYIQDISPTVEADPFLTKPGLDDFPYKYQLAPSKVVQGKKQQECLSAQSSRTSNKSKGSTETSVSCSGTVCVERIKAKMSPFKYGLFLLITAWLNALSNGALPSLQSYSCLPYGITAYHLSVTLANIANPVACFATFFITATSVKVTSCLTALGTGLAAYVIFTAATSPEPPLVDHNTGPFTVILAWILVVFTLTYAKVSIATVFRTQGRKALLWTGAATQVGSLCGALVTFFLVNYYNLFEVANPCKG